MVGFWRGVYYYIGWEYPERWDEQQRWYKYWCCKEIEEIGLVPYKLKKVKWADLSWAENRQKNRNKKQKKK